MQTKRNEKCQSDFFFIPGSLLTLSQQKKEQKQTKRNGKHKINHGKHGKCFNFAPQYFLKEKTNRNKKSLSKQCVY